MGLPTFIQSYVQIVRAYDFNLSEDCSRNVSFNIVTSSAYDSVRWYFNGLLMNPANTSTAVSPIHSYTADGEYEVSLVVYYSNGCSGLTDTIRRTIRVGNKYFDLEKCCQKNLLYRPQNFLFHHDLFCIRKNWERLLK